MTRQQHAVTGWGAVLVSLLLLLIGAGIAVGGVWMLVHRDQVQAFWERKSLSPKTARRMHRSPLYTAWMHVGSPLLAIAMGSVLFVGGVVAGVHALSQL
jgi:hypothetical protein